MHPPHARLTYPSHIKLLLDAEMFLAMLDGGGSGIRWAPVYVPSKVTAADDGCFYYHS